MNPISLPIAELKPALVGLGKVINPRSTLPVLQHLKVERTADGWIALTGTDLDRFVTVRLEQPSTGPAMTVLIPHDQLVQLTKNCDRNESLLIDSTPDGPVIRFALADNLGESKVKPIPVAEFPVTPRLQGEANCAAPFTKRWNAPASTARVMSSTARSSTPATRRPTTLLAPTAGICTARTPSRCR